MKRRDITLGEMQDECKRRKLNEYEVKCGGCQYAGICKPMPCDYNLIDPPRFTEAQMALLKGLHAVGGVRLDAYNGVTSLTDAHSNRVVIADALGIKDETLDLAELLGKEDAK